MTRKKKRIALLIDFIISDYASIILSGIREACSDFDIELVVFPIGQLHNVTEPYVYQMIAITSLISKNNIDGVIFESGTQMQYVTLDDLLTFVNSFKPLPVVNISCQLPGIPSVSINCGAAYKELIKNLVNTQKCRKVAIVGVQNDSSEVNERINSIYEAFDAVNISKEEIYFFESKFDYGVTMNELESYYAEYKTFDFDTLIALNDNMAYACMDFCKKIGKRIPKDVVITGFDDLEKSSYIYPRLTTINQQIFEKGYKACEVMNLALQGKAIPEKTIIDTKAIVRESTTRYSNENEKNSSLIKFETLEKFTSENLFMQNEWYEKKNQFYQVTKFYTDMQNDMSMTKLQQRINNDLKTFGITACGIVIYDKPIEKNTPFDYFNLPHKAFVFSAFDYATGVDYCGVEERLYFDPNKTIFPEGLIVFDSSGEIAISLFHGSIQYGYLIYRRGPYDISIYDLLSKIISTIISSVYTYELIDDQRAAIAAKYNKLDVVANTDELTGLHNRRALYELGQETLEYSKKVGNSGLVVYCDIDGLKKINDNYGHDAGDKAIIAESIILKSNFRGTDIVARIGGDEFIIICPGLTQDKFLEIKANIVADCIQWTDFNKTQFKLSISLGSAVYDPKVSTDYQLTKLLAEADAALYKEKRLKKTKHK